jgi:hypothetical protein
VVEVLRSPTRAWIVKLTLALLVSGAGLVLLTASGESQSCRMWEVETPPDEHEVDTDGRAPRPPWENAPAVSAAFTRESYRPGDDARLALWHHERELVLQVFRSGAEHEPTIGNITMNGVAVSAPRTLAACAAHRPIRVAIGDWRSGLYFARLEAPDGRVGFAPFVVEPRRLGEHRVLVVLPTYTWQAYNFRDDDGDGIGDTWYAAWTHHTARLARPYLARGVPPHFVHYDLPFLKWLARTGRDVDVIGDAALAHVPSGEALAGSYRLVVFPGHHEYVTTHEYDVVERYRDLGGNLMFLAANDFFWKVTVRGDTMARVAEWRDLRRPESALIGVQFIGNDGGYRRGPWHVANRSAGWPFAGSVAARTGAFGWGGVEIDHTTRFSPPGTHVIAEIPHLFGPHFTAQMTYYETTAGAKVFAAGAFGFTGACNRVREAPILENLWRRLTSDER